MNNTNRIAVCKSLFLLIRGDVNKIPNAGVAGTRRSHAITPKVYR